MYIVLLIIITMLIIGLFCSIMKYRQSVDYISILEQDLKKTEKRLLTERRKTMDRLPVIYDAVDQAYYCFCKRKEEEANIDATCKFCIHFGGYNACVTHIYCEPDKE